MEIDELNRTVTEIYEGNEQSVVDEYDEVNG